MAKKPPRSSESKSVSSVEPEITSPAEASASDDASTPFDTSDHTESVDAGAAETAALAGRVQELEAALAGLDAAHRQHIEEANGIRQALNEQHAAHEAAITAQAAAHEAAIAALNAEHATKLDEARTAAASEAAALKASMDAVQTECGSLMARADSLQTQLTAMTALHDALAAKLADLADCELWQVIHAPINNVARTYVLAKNYNDAGAAALRMGVTDIKNVNVVSARKVGF